MAFGGVPTVHALQKPRLRGTPIGITQEEAVEGNIWSHAFETPLYFLKKMIQNTSLW